MTATRPFRAFVSYCHVDVKFAAWLQRKLEGYRLPRRLADRVAPMAGQSQGRIGPVFRDRADLSASADLSAAVKMAIAASSTLIVIASPDTANSRWVAREIALFRELHPNAPILVALFRGEPGEAVPQELCEAGVEPLAADFRRAGDGRRLAFLKIVAALAGVPLDALVQRDAQRQVQRVTTVTLGAAIFTIGMAAMLMVALRARAETERQRADAERLIEFMLTDLRKEFEADGRFRVMDAANERALAYYAAQGDLQDLPDASLDRRARVVLAMGEDDEKRDRLDSALAKFNEARRTTAAILARKPRDTHAIYAHAQSEYWVGRISERRKDWPGALASYQAYDAAARRLVAADPSNPKFMMEAAFGRMNLGLLDSLRRIGPDYGRHHVLAALEWFGKAAAARPNDPEIEGEIANAHAWLADSYYIAGDYVRSISERKRELDRRTWIAARDASSNAARYRLAAAKFSYARNLMRLARKAEAAPLLADANSIMVRLVALEPDNKQWRSVLARIEKTRNMGAGK